MATNETIETLRNSTVFGTDGEKIGKVGELYLDAQTGEPTFVTVNTGFFGTNESFIPVDKARYAGEEIHVPYTKEFVKDAPSIAEDGELSPAEEQRLYEYYSLTAGTATAGVANTERPATDAHAAQATATAENGDVVAHEERLNVGTATSATQTGQVRLRKVVRTETETVEVPVRKEEIVVERTNLKDGEVVENYDFDSAEAQADVTVTAHEERPVVSTETVATERVSVGKEVRTDTERVSADVRKEEIVVEGDNK
ncbi:DUF2382 domain-containing protein [Rothia nasimurium]|uniref:DUF2382 domain-containing protein n=1 Tax=Rothia nasimurium TaxID=85336 RepID=UPI001F188BC9|nr:PRC and DUF2382 domain-containing protein [Rothia nasimurium]